MTYNDQILRYKEALSKTVRRGIFIDVFANVLLSSVFVFLIFHAHFANRI